MKNENKKPTDPAVVGVSTDDLNLLKAQKEELEKRYYKVSLDPIYDINNERETLYDQIWELKKQIKKLK